MLEWTRAARSRRQGHCAGLVAGSGALPRGAARSVSQCRRRVRRVRRRSPCLGRARWAAAGPRARAERLSREPKGREVTADYAVQYRDLAEPVGRLRRVSSCPPL